MLVHCAQCGMELKKRKGQVARAKHVFCSVLCKGEHQKGEMVTKNCKVCGTGFLIRRCDTKKRSVCNNPDCKVQSRLGKFASAWNGGVNHRRSGRVVSWRNQVLRRDGYQCVLCGSRDAIVADHIKPWALYPEFRYDVNNGRALCWECHKKIMKDFYVERKRLKELGLYKREIHPNRVIETLSCPECGCQFLNTNGQMRFCSKRCACRVQQRRRVSLRRSQGLCKVCSTPSLAYRCDSCREKSKLEQRVRRESKAENG